MLIESETYKGAKNAQSEVKKYGSQLDLTN